jgi:hypothetical protein
MFNINLDFKNIDTLAKGPVGIALVTLFLMTVSFFFGLVSVSQTKDEMCKQEIELSKVQQKQILNLETEKAQVVSKYSTACIEREQRVCRDEKEAIKKNCNDLIDRLFPKKAKNK